MSWELYTNIVCSALIGFDKGGIPGLGALGMAFALSIHGSSKAGHILALFVPVLAFADIWAIFAYRNAINMSIVKAFIFPLGFGISAGFLLLGKFSDDVIRRTAGGALLGLSLFYNFSGTIKALFSKRRRDINRSDDDSDVLPMQIEVKPAIRNDSSSGKLVSTPLNYLHAISFGFASGVLTVIANVAGPVVAVYLMSLHLPKREVNGTRAFIFLLANCVKIPAQIMIGNLHTPDVILVLPLALFAGSVALLTEAYAIPYINQKTFERAAWILVTFSALKLVLWL